MFLFFDFFFSICCCCYFFITHMISCIGFHMFCLWLKIKVVVGAFTLHVYVLRSNEKYNKTKQKTIRNLFENMHTRKCIELWKLTNFSGDAKWAFMRNINILNSKESANSSRWMLEGTKLRVREQNRILFNGKCWHAFNCKQNAIGKYFRWTYKYTTENRNSTKMIPNTSHEASEIFCHCSLAHWWIGQFYFNLNKQYNTMPSNI